MLLLCAILLKSEFSYKAVRMLSVVGFPWRILFFRAGTEHPSLYTERVMSEKPKNPSWALILTMVAIALLVAVAISYLVVSPFFHH